MVEIDEAAVRAKLLAMQERIVRDPFDALGLATSVTPDGVRSAFLELTKVYHPARFGRMSPEIQRLANEVFLALRSAHDAVARTVRARATTAPTGATTKPTADPQAMAALAVGTARTPFGQGARPATSPGVATKRPTDQVPPLGPPERPTPMPVRSRTAEVPVLQKPAATAATTTSRVPVQPVRQTGIMPAIAKATPAEGTRVVAPTLPPGPERDVASALELLGRGQWDAGRAILQSLAERHPTVPRYRALVCYALGRQAQVEQRLNEARVELDRALQIDPTLQLAKTALGELFSRRK